MVLHPILGIGIVFGILVGFVHYFSNKVIAGKKYHTEIMSLAAGISLTYLLLFLLPELYEGIETLQKLLFLFVLFGALAFHMVEKYIYQHEKKNKIMRDLSIVHAVSFFTYHFIVGVVLVHLLQRNILTGVLFLLPILSFTAVGQVSLREIRGKLIEKNFIRIGLSAATLIGVIEAIYLPLPPAAFYSLMGFVAGAMLYQVMRENIPSEKYGNAMWFLMGAFIYAIIIMFIWTI